MNYFQKNLIDNIPRILNQLDSNSYSKTYGCFDRDYWHYKTIDFPCARKQEAVLSLALAYKLKDKNNPYYNQEYIFNLVIAGIKFWQSIQNNNGSFSEWYPLEHSFVASAFSTYAITETILELKLNLKNDKKLIKTIKKAANFLSKTNEFRVQNQESGSIIALYNCYLITKRLSYLGACKLKVKKLRQKQNNEGWFDEYGGPDLGYLSLTIDYLNKYYEKSKDKNVLKIIEKSISFLKNFLHPDYTCGGIYLSRNTEYLIPSAFNNFPEINNFCYIGMSKNKIINCSSVDDRYLLYNGYTYLQTKVNSKNKKTINFGLNFKKYLKNSGLIIINNKRYYFACNLNKGGSFFYYSKLNKKLINDSGIFLRDSNKNSYSNSFIGSAKNKVVKNNVITIEGNFQKIPQNTMNINKNIMIRVFQLVFGRFENLQKKFKEKARDRLITPSENDKLNLKYYRTITLEEDCIEVKNKVLNCNNISEVLTFAKNPYQYTPSARFFSSNNLYECDHNISKVKTLRVNKLNGTNTFENYIILK